MALYEAALSEFYISRQELLFHYTFPQLALLMYARNRRNEESERRRESSTHKGTYDQMTGMVE